MKLYFLKIISVLIRLQLKYNGLGGLLVTQGTHIFDSDQTCAIEDLLQLEHQEQTPDRNKNMNMTKIKL